MRLGVEQQNIFVCDSKGVIHHRADRLDESKRRYQQRHGARTLADVMPAPTSCSGCSAAGVVTQDMVKSMAHPP